ncbi:Retrovirus-related Pol polyprotein from transposon 17.6 [Mytilus coruscus]|uniref:Retrovirus-related Pol polyprotein from transposon 17.6 n=1 Tax=Mytilus coruscus TaxID=42192 RepID=A0A6J8DQS7_MYTCO|nr:Retrovirus-related Pol polyprotein from transposon 17.6 [Mytilus coruscus]
MRKWRPPDATPEEEWRVVYQVVVPKVYRQDIIGLAHDTPLAGHLGIRKTCLKILQHFYWPRLRNDVAEYCKSCHICHFVGKPNQKIPPAPLLPIPAFENLSAEYSLIALDLYRRPRPEMHVPNKTTADCHDVDVGDASPIKQHPYRPNPLKLEFMRQEIKYMLDNDIIEPSNSELGSPCLLVPKPDKTFRFVTDFRKVNSVSKSDSYPIPMIDDCIDNIGKAKFVSKFDLLKGYWQVPLKQRAREISAFVTPDGSFQYTVMPFGMKSAPATFQRTINNVIKDLDCCYDYIDDLIVCSDSWEEHLTHLYDTFDRLSQSNLTVNLGKSEFCQATVDYLGHTVGQGQVKPIMAKVDAITKCPPPTNKKQLMRYLGMIGFYRKFCSNFATVVQPLTHLLRKDSKFIWSENCQNAFENSKSLLMNSPVLITTDFEKQFKLAVDASDVGVGAVLYQETDDNDEKPISYFSKKLDKHQKNYSTIEKECFALLSALQHFDVYLNPTVHPILVYTDHNPLTFIHKMRNKNQRLTRWSLLLQEYDVIVKQIKGKNNVIADALSRTY